MHCYWNKNLISEIQQKHEIEEVIDLSNVSKFRCFKLSILSKRVGSGAILSYKWWAFIEMLHNILHGFTWLGSTF